MSDPKPDQQLRVIMDPSGNSHRRGNFAFIASVIE